MKVLHPIVRDFYAYLMYSKNPKTAYNYARNVDMFLSFIEKDPKEITPVDIVRWYEHLKNEGYSERSIWRYGWALRSFFDFIGLKELKDRVPIPPVKVREPLWLDEETTFKLIDRVAVLCVAYDLALRVNEVPLLRLSEFKPETGKITVTRLKRKGHYDKITLKLEEWCLEILNEYIERNRPRIRDVIFPFSAKTIQNIFRRRANAIGLDKKYKFHCLRHSRITHIAIRQLKEKGVVDIVSLAQFAGHVNINTTLMYIHLASKYLAFGR